MALRIDCVHEYGFKFLRSIAKHLQHKLSGKNYPVDDEAGAIYVQMVQDLVVPFLMFSPNHASTNDV